MVPARWYVPKAGDLPAHLPPLARRTKCAVVAGPDGGEGWVYGGILEPRESGWVQDPAGWWVNVQGLDPAALARAVPVDGLTVTCGPWQWHVPTLVARGAAGTLVAAGERIRTAKGWELPDLLRHPTDLALDLARRWQAGEVAGTQELTEQVALAAVGINYHLTLTEAISGTWWTESTPVRIAAAALGVPHE